MQEDIIGMAGFCFHMPLFFDGWGVWLVRYYLLCVAFLPVLYLLRMQGQVKLLYVPVVCCNRIGSDRGAFLGVCRFLVLAFSFFG